MVVNPARPTRPIAPWSASKLAGDGHNGQIVAHRCDHLAGIEPQTRQSLNRADRIGRVLLRQIGGDGLARREQAHRDEKCGHRHGEEDLRSGRGHKSGRRSMGATEEVRATVVAAKKAAAWSDVLHHALHHNLHHTLLPASAPSTHVTCLTSKTTLDDGLVVTAAVVVAAR